MGAQISGPMAKPKTNSEMPRVAMIWTAPNSTIISRIPPEKADETKATARVATATSMVRAHLTA